MIDVSNLKDALETLGFVAHGDIHEKVFPEIGCSLKVDFHAKKLIYPNEIKGRERNNGFDKKENFVVFECVCRLLSKGYRPEHIELDAVMSTTEGNRLSLSDTEKFSVAIGKRVLDKEWYNSRLQRQCHCAVWIY